MQIIVSCAHNSQTRTPTAQTESAQSTHTQHITLGNSMWSLRHLFVFVLIIMNVGHRRAHVDQWGMVRWCFMQIVHGNSTMTNAYTTSQYISIIINILCLLCHENGMYAYRLMSNGREKMSIVRAPRQCYMSKAAKRKTQRVDEIFGPSLALCPMCVWLYAQSVWSFSHRSYWNIHISVQS